MRTEAWIKNQFKVQRSEPHEGEIEEIMVTSRPFGSKLRSGLEKLGSYLLKISTAVVLITGAMLIFDLQGGDFNLRVGDIETMSTSAFYNNLLPWFKYSLFGVGIGCILDSLFNLPEEEF